MNEMVGPARLELATSRLSSVRSNQLSYEPVIKRTVSPDGSADPNVEERNMRATVNANAPDTSLERR